MLKVTNLSFGYIKNKTVLEDLTFFVKAGEHLCIMGESGCGKSTLLKLLYGLLDTDKGKLFWNEEEVTGPKLNLVPGFESFKYVAQDFDLMPYISVSENIKKFLSRFYPAEAEKRTLELLEVIEMEDFADAKVKNLSGGQQQRVAIARALAKEPKLLLLDEPFGQIDNFRKNSLRRKLFSYLKAQNIACVVATHDKNDALSFADKLIVLRDKEIVVNDSPKTIYQNPNLKYIATLFDDVNEIDIDGKKALLYPHQIIIEENSVNKAFVTNSYFKGSYWLIEVQFENQKLFLNHFSDLEKGKNITIKFNIPAFKANTSS